MNRFIKYIAFPVCMILLSTVTKAQTMSLQPYRQNVIDYSQQLKQANE